MNENNKELNSPGIRLITRFEGYQFAAYPDPAHGWDVPTIGYGTTVYHNGQKVKPGDRLSEEKARFELNHFLDQNVRPRLMKIPKWNEMHECMQGALESFAYNVGPYFYGNLNDFMTITKVLKHKKWNDFRSAIVLYSNPGTNVHAGLLSRREAEASAWEYGLKMLGKPVILTDTQKDKDFVLDAPYFSQRDSLILYEGRNHAMRSCQSSSLAMMLEYMVPGTLHGANGDDDYLRTVFSYGDTTESTAQIQAMRRYGVDIKMRTDMSFEDIDSILKSGMVIPIGILHHGHVSNPYGGHWIVIIGKTADGKFYYVHDPYGEADLVNGGYNISASGKALKYSKENLGPRWRPGNSGGWGYVLV